MNAIAMPYALALVRVLMAEDFKERSDSFSLLLEVADVQHER